MHGNRVTLALSFLGFGLVECTFLGLMLSMWCRRKSLLVRARSPALAMVSVLQKKELFSTAAESSKVVTIRLTHIAWIYHLVSLQVQGGFIMMLFAAIVVQVRSCLLDYLAQHMSYRLHAIAAHYDITCRALYYSAVQEIMRAHDIAGFPCPVMMWASVICAPM
jgi:hypothetical protein